MFSGCKQGVHKFQPRYDETEAAWVQRAIEQGVPFELKGGWPDKDKRYVCDVCVRCGKVIDARKQAATGLQAIPGNLFGAGAKVA